MISTMEWHESRTKAETTKVRSRRIALSPLFYEMLAFISFVIGILSIIVGQICSLIASQYQELPRLGTIGTVLLTISIPLLLLGAVFLDKAEEQSND